MLDLQLDHNLHFFTLDWYAKKTCRRHDFSRSSPTSTSVPTSLWILFHKAMYLRHIKLQYKSTCSTYVKSSTDLLWNSWPNGRSRTYHIKNNQRNNHNIQLKTTPAVDKYLKETSPLIERKRSYSDHLICVDKCINKIRTILRTNSSTRKPPISSISTYVGTGPKYPMTRPNTNDVYQGTYVECGTKQSMIANEIKQDRTNKYVSMWCNHHHKIITNVVLIN